MKVKKFLVFLGALIVLIGSPYGANAALVSMTNASGDMVVWDDTADQYWYGDLSDFTLQTYSSQLTNIDNLNDPSDPYFGFGDWHMASYEEMLDLWEYDQYDIYPEFLPSIEYPIEDEAYWKGRYDSTGPTPDTHYAAYVFGEDSVWWAYDQSTLTELWPSDSLASSELGAWVTSAGQPVQPVPEPAAILLLSSGLLGLAALRRRFRK
jgi:hypothetical protein